MPKRTGRVGFDDKGNAVWEWEKSTGIFARDISTTRLRRLQDALELSDGDQSAAARRTKKRTLDDMRRLSEQIKRKRGRILP